MWTGTSVLLVCLAHRTDALICWSNTCVFVNEGGCFWSLATPLQRWEADGRALAVRVGSGHLAPPCGFCITGARAPGNGLGRAGEPAAGRWNTPEKGSWKGPCCRRFLDCDESLDQLKARRHLLESAACLPPPASRAFPAFPVLLLLPCGVPEAAGSTSGRREAQWREWLPWTRVTQELGLPAAGLGHVWPVTLDSILQASAGRDLRHQWPRTGQPSHKYTSRRSDV